MWCAVPPAQLPLVAQTLPAPYLERFMRFLAAELESTRHFHLLLLWVQQLLLSHGQRIRDEPSRFEVSLRALAKGTRLRADELIQMCNSNTFSLTFLEDQLARHLDLTETETTGAASSHPAAVS